MDPRLLEYYNRELQFLREMGAEFAAQYPRVAARLDMDGTECSDPYVERLLEGVAFLTARVQLKIQARHPEFTQHLMEMVYPHFLAPVPACAIAEFTPDLKEDALQGGVRIERGAGLRTELAKGQRTACEFRTSQDVVLWPLSVAEAQYISGTGALAAAGIDAQGPARAAIRLRLQCGGGIALNSLDVDELTFFIKATSDVAARIQEQVLADGVGVVVRGADGRSQALRLDAQAVSAGGFSAEEALLPSTHRTFEGYRLLQEYFAFPDRFLFFKVKGFSSAVRACTGNALDLFLLLGRVQPTLENVLDPAQFRLYCTPIINLFRKSLDQLHLNDFETEHHVVPDRNRPMDFEVYSIERVGGLGTDERAGMLPIQPFYSAKHYKHPGADSCYFTVQRRPRLYSTQQRHSGERTAYLGSECFVSIVDGREQSASERFRRLDFEALCTNRDLPIHASFGKGRTDFLLDAAAPVESIRCLSGPTWPRASPAFGETAWKLVNHLSLNYLSLRDSQSGTQLLRELLSLYAGQDDAVLNRQVEGVRGVAYDPVVERIPGGGPISFGRGLKISLTLDDTAFEGTGVLSLGAVLEQFFARYVSINSFTRTELYSAQRGRIKQWPVRVGARPTL